MSAALEKRVRMSAIAWRRKRMLERRFTFEVQWQSLFPRHDFADLRRIQPFYGLPPSWDAAARAASARAYHRDRARR